MVCPGLVFCGQNMDYITHYNSPLGGITLACDGEALTGSFFDGQRYWGSTLTSHCGNREDIPVFEQTRRWLDIFFSGDEPDFIPPLSLHGTAFQQRVWEALLSIPYGETVTYGQLAKRLGVRSAQAVGGAVGRNPISIIVPCHRVVGTNGSLTGYASGLDRKRAMLELER